VASEAAVEEPSRAALASILPQLFVRVDGVDHLVVLKTAPGGGQTVAHALDREPATDIIGTIAGDDTILMICRSEQARERVVRRLEKLGRGG
jgi:transcriptional regulator of arginine metabolism